VSGFFVDKQLNYQYNSLHITTVSSIENIKEEWKVEQVVGKTKATEIILPKGLDEAIDIVKSAETGILVIPCELCRVTKITRLLQSMKAGLSATVEGGKLLLECIEEKGIILFRLKEKDSAPFKWSSAAYEAARGLVGSH